MSEDRKHLAGGDFSTWLSQVSAALKTGGEMDVPCGACTACCKSSQFAHVDRNEAETLSRIPRELLFPAPGQPSGNMLMGYDEQGRCPMLIDDKCSIYAHRPKTCRTYDCRVFPAAGIAKASIEKPLIARQAERWEFALETQRDRAMLAAVQAAADFLHLHPECFAGGAPSNSTHVAAMAIKVHGVFLDRAAEDRDVVQAIIAESRRQSV
jgi:Fe-S-cluster containining protein